MALKKVGIVADNYKLDSFKEKFLSMGIKFKMSSFTKDTTTIILEVPEDKVMEVKKVCEEVERFYEHET